MILITASYLLDYMICRTFKNMTISSVKKLMHYTTAFFLLTSAPLLDREKLRFMRTCRAYLHPWDFGFLHDLAVVGLCSQFPILTDWSSFFHNKSTKMHPLAFNYLPGISNLDRLIHFPSAMHRLAVAKFEKCKVYIASLSHYAIFEVNFYLPFFVKLFSTLCWWTLKSCQKSAGKCCATVR